GPPPRRARARLPEAHARATRGARLPSLPRSAAVRGREPAQHPARHGEIPDQSRDLGAQSEPRGRRADPNDFPGASRMTAPHDDLIRAFIAEGREELPDRAFDAVRGEIHRTRQRVVIGPWREPQMSNLAKVALAAAAVVAVLFGASR